MVFALQATTGSGPNDLLAGQDGRAYWVSTLRYPAGHWQTAAFDQSLAQPLDRPVFLMNTTSDPTDALVNHLAALMVIAENPRSEWPTGVHDQCSDPAWKRAVELVTGQVTAAGQLEGNAGVVGAYVALRNRYHARHR
jgi:hypothetical protein